MVKSFHFVERGRKGTVQPAVKCRGQEYLCIIYGPEYTAPEHLARVVRSLAAKRSLALREFALGIEALERLVRGEPLRRVHECVFGVLVLESEPVAARLGGPDAKRSATPSENRVLRFLTCVRLATRLSRVLEGTFQGHTTRKQAGELCHS